MSQKRSQIWVSAVLYTMVAAISIAFILQAGIPLVEGMRDRSVFNRMQNQMLALDEVVDQIASEGRGSQRSIPFEISQGDLVMDDGGFRWEMTTGTRIVEPRSSYRVGNLQISANSDVEAYEYQDHYILENSNIRVRLLKAGTSSDRVMLNTSDVVEEITILETNETVEPDFEFKIADDDSSKEGEAFTSLSRTGRRLGSSSHITSVRTEDYDYDLYITLDGEADFIRADIRNFDTR